MSQGQRRLYIVGVLLWMSFGLLFPVWVGRSYSGGGQPRRSGSFALQGGRGFGKRAPIWSPPRRASGFTSVRWPWQAPRGGNHVEISIARLCAFWTVGILVLGFVVGGVSWISHPKKPDPFLATVWSISTSLALGWICIFVLAALSMGYAATEPVIVGVLLFSALAGLAYGLGARCRRRERAREASKSQELAKQTSALSSQGDPNNAVHQVGKRILLFVLGVAAGLGMWLAARRVSNFFKSSDIDLATGFFTLGAGLVLGIFLFRIYRYRAFVHGLCLATTVVGLTCVRLPGIWLVPIWVLVVLAVQWKRASFRLQLWQFLVGAICLALLLALPGRVLFFHWNMRRTMQRSRQNVDQIVERYIGAASAENEPEVQKIRQQILQLEMDDSRAFSYLFLKLNVLLPKVPEPARAGILQFLSSEALARNERGSPSDYAQRMAIIVRDVNQPLAIRCEALKVLLNWSVLSEVADAMMVLPEDEKDQFEPVVYEFFDQRRVTISISPSAKRRNSYRSCRSLCRLPTEIVAVLIVILDNIPDHGQLPREVAHMLGEVRRGRTPCATT